jgi:hypothetical protein
MSRSRKKVGSYVVLLDEQLGEGSWAKVFLAQGEPAGQYAVKIIERAKSTPAGS